MACVVYVVHRVEPLPKGAEERGTIALEVFTRQFRALRRAGITFVEMRSLLAAVQAGEVLRGRTAVLTFDDGDASILEHAFPVLEQNRVPFTVFVPAGLMGQTSGLYAKKGGKPHRHLGADELKALVASGLAEIGAHGHGHVALTGLGPAELERELSGARANLENALGAPVRYLAYPYGKADDALVGAVKRSGYELGFTTRKGRISSGRADRWRLPRVNWGRKATFLGLLRFHLVPGFLRSPFGGK